MGTTTPRLQLYKPAEAGEIVDVAKLNQNSDKLDTAAGGLLCTSTTRPGAGVRYPGMLCFETDTLKAIMWDGASLWHILNPDTMYYSDFTVGTAGSIGNPVWSLTAAYDVTVNVAYDMEAILSVRSTGVPDTVSVGFWKVGTGEFGLHRGPAGYLADSNAQLQLRARARFVANANAKICAAVFPNGASTMKFSNSAGAPSAQLFVTPYAYPG